jgi:hypothetical protein
MGHPVLVRGGLFDAVKHEMETLVARSMTGKQAPEG